MARLMTSLALAATLAAGGALAADNPLCGVSDAGKWDAIRDSFVGTWQIDHLAGYVQAGGMTIAYPQSPDPDTVGIALFGDELVAVHPDAAEPLLLRFADEPRWAVRGGPDVLLLPTSPGEGGPSQLPTPISPDEAALVYGDCEQTEMPRLIGTSTVNMEGITMDFTYRMMVLTDDRMYGIMEVTGTGNGIPYLARRAVWMERVD